MITKHKPTIPYLTPTPFLSHLFPILTPPFGHPYPALTPPTVVYPMEIVKTRLMVSNPDNYRVIFECASTLLKKDIC